MGLLSNLLHALSSIANCVYRKHWPSRDNQANCQKMTCLCMVQCHNDMLQNCQKTRPWNTQLWNVVFVDIFYLYIHITNILNQSFIYAKNLEQLSYQLLSQISSHQYWENKADTAQCLPSRLNKIIVMSYHFIIFMHSSLMMEFGVYILLFGGIFTGIRNMMGPSWFSEVDMFVKDALTENRPY